MLGEANATALDLFRGAPGEAPVPFYLDRVLSYAEVDELSDRNLVHNARLSGAHFDLGSQSRIFAAPLFHVTGFELQLPGAFAADAAQVLTYRLQPAVVSADERHLETLH